MIDAVSDVIDLVVHLVAFQQLAGSAAAGGKIRGKLFQVGGDVVGVVVNRLVVDKFTSRAFAALDLCGQLFGVLNRRVEIVIESFVVEQAPDGAFPFSHPLDDFVKFIRELA